MSQVGWGFTLNVAAECSFSWEDENERRCVGFSEDEDGWDGFLQSQRGGGVEWTEQGWTREG